MRKVKGSQIIILHTQTHNYIQIIILSALPDNVSIQPGNPNLWTLTSKEVFSLVDLKYNNKWAI